MFYEKYNINVNEIIDSNWVYNALKDNEELAMTGVESCKIIKTLDRNLTILCFLDILFKNKYEELISINVLLKIFKPDSSGEIRGKEDIEFYRIITKYMPHMYDYVYSYGYDSYMNTHFIMMKDLSKTHYSRKFSSSEHTINELEMFTVEIAKFHAYWWDNSLLGNGVGEYTDQNRFDNYVNRLKEEYKYFYENSKGDIPGEKFDLYERAINSLDTVVYKRLQSKKNMTIIHGDCHLGNILFPYDNKDRRYLIDCSLDDISLGVKDFALAISLNYYRKKRNEIELNLLKLYYKTLLECGVKTYSWDELIYDFRLSIFTNIFCVIRLCNQCDVKNVWWGWYIKSFMAFEDYNCNDLICS